MSFHTRLAAIGAAALLLFSATGCSLLPETQKREEPIPLTAQPTSISALEPEVTALVQELDADAVLTEATVVYQGNEAVKAREGSITFTYFSTLPEEKRVTTTTVLYDMKEEAVFQITSTESSQYFCTTPTQPVGLTEDSPVAVTFDSLFDAIYQDQSFANKLGGTNIKLTFDYTGGEVELSIL